MREVTIEILKLERELMISKAEVRRLANEEVIDIFKIIELCTKMDTIASSLLILDRVNEEVKLNTIPYYN
ncbi:MAG: hypothetical protein M1445_04250 [Bacteroidetes bacterium]|nr:hypothetical protein [Bacteroidota bacterium]MCL6103689.1 hypothetical protein [Bacteroidota bacterium]